MLEELVMNTRPPATVTVIRPRRVGLTSIAHFMVVLDSMVVVTAVTHAVATTRAVPAQAHRTTASRNNRPRRPGRCPHRRRTEGTCNV